MKSKLRKIFLILGIAVMTLAIGMQTKSFAAEELNLGIQVLRQQREEPESGAGKQWGYRFTATDNGGANADHRYVWKIVERQEPLNEAHFNYSKDIYCLRAGIGFDANGTSDLLKYETYNKSQIIMGGEESLTGRSLANFSNTYTAVNNQVIMDALHLTDENDLKAIKWILNNMYLRNSSDSEIMKTELLEKAITGNEDIAKGEIKKWITLDDIEIAQQIALWHFTNNSEDAYDFGDGEGNTFKSFYTGSEWTSDSVNNFDSLANEDLYPDGDGTLKPGVIREEGIKELYKYFIDQAVAHANDTQTVPDLKFATKDSEIKKDGSKVVAGPFSFKDNNNSGRLTNFALIVKNNNSVISDYKIVKGDGTEYPAGTTAEDLLGQEFYIQVSDTSINKINVQVTASYFNTKATMWTKDPDNNVQPVVIVEKTKVDVQDADQAEYTEIPEFDLALRKFISSVNGATVTPSREPQVTAVDSSGNATYTHPKDPILVESGDKVVYTIRVYNEGELDGYAKEITDHIPSGLEFVPASESKTNQDYRWVDRGNGMISTDYLSKEVNATDNLIKAYDATKNINEQGIATPSYKEVKVECKVTEPNSSKNIITNIAEISQDDNITPHVNDRDSVPGTSGDYDFTPGAKNEDDIDYEKLQLKEFDLALRKFITEINGIAPTVSREPIVKIDKDTGKITYEHTKEPLPVQNGDLVTYTLRVYNEGQTDGYASEIMDNVPEGLEFVVDNPTNIEYMWSINSQDGTIRSTYLAKRDTDINDEKLLKAFDKETMAEPDYKDIKIVFKVIEPNISSKIIENTAEISDDRDKNNNPVIDIDSTPDNKKEGEDDIDHEYVILKYFDLALRKFITGVNEKEITDRVPVVKVTENGAITYEHTKEPVLVATNNIVTYTLRIYNEGTLDGYASLVEDDVPEGLEFLPDNEINKTYGWKLSEDGKTITTDYLAKKKNGQEEKKEEQTDTTETTEQTTEDHLIKAFDRETMKEPDYKDIKVAFKVIEPGTSERILINIAEIADDTDKDGNPIEDVDSVPGNHKDGEDDIDKEYVKLTYFDLALLKYVKNSIVIENGQETVTETGYDGTEVPKPIVKVELDRKKLEDVEVKFTFTIKIINEGKIAGYAKEVSDYIPEGLEFIPEENPQWTVQGDKIVTEALANTLLQPGESATVDVVLRWVKDPNNMGLKTNVAEISKDYNDFDTPDIDSTPNNKKEGEDDIDYAHVMLSIKTGGAVLYVTLTAGVLGLLTGGIFLIKKYVM